MSNKLLKQTPKTVSSDTDTSVDTQTDEETGSTKEYGGPKGLEPTRYGDWEKAGRCIDF